MRITANRIEESPQPSPNVPGISASTCRLPMAGLVFMAQTSAGALRVVTRCHSAQAGASEVFSGEGAVALAIADSSMTNSGPLPSS